MSLYEQLAALLRAQIDAGAFPKGRLPSETALRQTHGLARDTVRKAVALLRQEGLVVVERGRGVAIRTDDQKARVRVPRGSRVDSRMPSPDEVAKHQMPEGVPMLVLTLPSGQVKDYPAHSTYLSFL